MTTARKSLRLLNVSQIAEVLGISTATASARLNAEGVEAAEIRGRVKVFDAPTALRALLVGSGGLDAQQERARFDRARSEAQEMKNAQRRGELVEGSAVVRTWSAKAVIVKNRLRALPAQAAATIPGVTPAVAKKLAVLVDRALTDLADDAEGVSAAGAAP